MARPNKWKTQFPVTRKIGRATEHLVACPGCHELRWLKASDITNLHGEPYCRPCAINRRWSNYYEKRQTAANQRAHLDGTAIEHCNSCGTHLDDAACHKNTFNLGKVGYRICKGCLRTLRARRREPYKESDAARARKSLEKDWAKWLLRHAKRRAGNFNIDLDWVYAAFIAQDKKCFWTGVEMIPSARPNHPLKPSLDRLDRDRGYEPDNVVLAALCVNLGRNEATEEQMHEYVGALKVSAKETLSVGN